VGVVANLVAIPLGAVAVPGLFVALLLSWVWRTGAELFAGGAGLALALLDVAAGAAAAVPGGHVVMAEGWRSGALWAGAAVLVCWAWRTPRWTGAARIACVACVASWGLVVRGVSLDAAPGLTVHFLDVGQGDAAVLRTPHGSWIVIDGGPRGRAGDAGRRVVVPFLRKHGVRRVALVMVSHGHADHLGGLPSVIRTFRPLAVAEPGAPLGEPLYLEWLAEVEGSGARWTPARAGDRLAVDGVALEVLSPDDRWVAAPLDPNEHSLVVRVTYGAVSLLFAGDAGLPVEERIAGRVGPVDVLKVGHHGSRTATSAGWLAELDPAVAVISVGRGNRYGHPAPEVLERLAQAGVTVLRTDRAGTITLTTDGTREHTNLRHHDRAVHHGAGAPPSRGDRRPLEPAVRHLPRGQDHLPQRAPRRAHRHPRRVHDGQRVGRPAAEARSDRQ
jgi:competence protein ComEC